MNTAALPFSRFGARSSDVSAPAPGLSAVRPDGFFPARSVLDAGDVSAVSFAFAFAASLVLAGAVACDAYLSAVLSRGPATLDDLASYQLAQALLPWAVAFTIIAGGVAAAGLRLACRLRRRSNRGIAEPRFGALGSRRSTPVLEAFAQAA